MTTQTTMPPEPPSTEPRQNELGRESVNPPVGPGAQLRQARLDLKLAPEDVANILHLSARQIVTLEDDDYANLPGPTYVRGYLRGYAQLLGLAPGPVIEAYNRVVAVHKPVDLGKLAPRPEIRSDHQLIKFATVGVIALILGLSAVWWQEQDEPAPVAPGENVPSPPGATDEPVQSDAPAADAIPRSEAPPASLPLPAMGDGAAAKPVPVQPPAQNAVNAAPARGTPALAAAPTAPVTSSAITGPRGRLLIKTTLDSWADVRDASGNRLLYEIVPAGRTVVVEGVAPLSVFLGNAEGVRVEFNGETFDVGRYRRGDLARFTLGSAARAPARTE